jgi:hypothetical protein
MDQIGLALPESEFQALLKGRTRVTAADGAEVSIIDLATPVKNDGAQAILAGLLFTGTQTIFVKLTAPRALALRERPNFTRLCQSLRFGGR